MANEINGSKLQSKIDEIAQAWANTKLTTWPTDEDIAGALAQFATQLKNAVKESTQK